MTLQYMVDLLGCEFLVEISIEAHTLNRPGEPELALQTSLYTLVIVSINNHPVASFEQIRLRTFVDILRELVIEQHSGDIADALREQTRYNGKDDREYDRMIDKEAFDG